MAIYKVAILEDDSSTADLLLGFTKKYANIYDVPLEISIFSNPFEFFNGTRPAFDIVFMDIEMPQMDGITAAKKLRMFDDKSILIFVTNLGHLAIKGYEVQAQDFVVKPVSYESFLMRLQRAVNSLKSNNEKYVMLPLPYGTMRLALSEIFFIEVMGHTLSFSTKKGIIETRGKLINYEMLLADYGFLRCSNCALVNTNFIERISSGNIYINKTMLQISRSRRKEFAEELKMISVGNIFLIAEKNEQRKEDTN